MEPQKYSLKAIKSIGKISTDGVVVYDIEQDAIVYSNKALSAIFHIATKQLNGSSFKVFKRTFKGEEDAVGNALAELKSKSKISNKEFRIEPETGEEKYISCDVYLLQDTGLLVAFVKDVTRLKEHTNYIVEFGARKDTLLEMISHNLTGPLNLTNNLLDYVDRQNQSQRYTKVDNYTRLIRENTQHCIEVINSFLREEHLESEKIFVQSKRFDALAKIKIVVAKVKDFSPVAIEVNSEVSELFITSDDVKFFQIIHNLLSNAVKFTPDKGKIAVNLIEGDDTVEVIISDTGIGIPEHLHAHVFKRNTPAARTGVRGENSIGMGLYIAKKLVERMKGSISFRSEEGEGATFTLVLPKS